MALIEADCDVAMLRVTVVYVFAKDEARVVDIRAPAMSSVERVSLMEDHRVELEDVLTRLTRGDVAA